MNYKDTVKRMIGFAKPMENVAGVAFVMWDKYNAPGDIDIYPFNKRADLYRVLNVDIATVFEPELAELAFEGVYEDGSVLAFKTGYTWIGFTFGPLDFSTTPTINSTHFTWL